jgi:hypothetical protein
MSTDEQPAVVRHRTCSNINWPGALLERENSSRRLHTEGVVPGTGATPSARIVSTGFVLKIHAPNTLWPPPETAESLRAGPCRGAALGECSRSERERHHRRNGSGGTFCAPGQFTIDAAVAKLTRVGRVDTELRMEAFNLLKSPRIRQSGQHDRRCQRRNHLEPDAVHADAATAVCVQGEVLTRPCCRGEQEAA